MRPVYRLPSGRIFTKAVLPPKECDWFDPTKPPFRLNGFAFFETDRDFYRYPKNPPEPLTEGVKGNALGSSSGQIHFSATTSSVSIRVKRRDPIGMTANTNVMLCAGFDLYASKGDGKYSLCGTTNFDTGSLCYEAVLLSSEKPQKLDFILNFPIREKIESVYIGLDKGVVPEAPPPMRTDKRIVFYGGSIVHGYCATRPDMTMPNIISRRRNQEVINLGVSGSGKCERATAIAVGMVERTELLIISTEGNCPTPEFLYEHLSEFLEVYRTFYPTVPIALMGYMKMTKELFDDRVRAARVGKKEAMLRIVVERRAKGDENIWYWDGEEFTDEENDIFFEGFSAGDECTVDTEHKSDLGFWLMANGVSRKIKELGL